jgi:transcriptional regulator with XRE-family HTH domain
MRLHEYLLKLGRNIKSARVHAGLRQIDVNELTGLTYRHYQSIEAGRVNVTVGTLCRLSRLFKSSIKDLIVECPE